LIRAGKSQDRVESPGGSDPVSQVDQRNKYFLTVEELEKAFVGNTITFPNRRGPGNVLMFFKKDGTYVTGRGNIGEWWTEGDDKFCRRREDAGRWRCHNVLIEGKTVRFYGYRSGKYRWEAELLDGDQR